MTDRLSFTILFDWMMMVVMVMAFHHLNMHLFGSIMVILGHNPKTLLLSCYSIAMGQCILP